jgi:hypothetical protein
LCGVTIFAGESSVGVESVNASSGSSLRPRVNQRNTCAGKVSFVTRYQREVVTKRSRGQQRVDNGQLPGADSRPSLDASPTLCDGEVQRQDAAREPRHHFRGQPRLEIASALLVSLHLNAYPELSEGYDTQEESEFIDGVDPSNKTRVRPWLS